MFDLRYVKQLNVVIRPTRYCQNNCQNCYISESKRLDNSVMSPSIFKQTCQFISEFSKLHNLTFLRLVWHGGEPLHVQRSWYEMTKPILDELPIAFSEDLQTSLSAYSKDWDDFIQSRLNSRLILSLDLNSRKYFGSSTEYLNIWKQRLEHFNLMKYNLLVVVTIGKTEIKNPRELFCKITELGLNPGTIVNFRKSCAVSTTTEYVTNAEYSKFLIQFYKEFMRFDSKNLLPNFEAITRPIRGILRQLENRLPVLPISEMFNCLRQPRMIIDSYGEISNCLMHENSKYGSVFDSPETVFDSAEHSKLRQRSALASVSTLKQCRDCAHTTWCYLRCFMPSIPQGVPDFDCPGSKIFNDAIMNSLEDFSTRQQLSEYLVACGIDPETTRFATSEIAPMHRDLAS